jgi:hypothetical protein
MFAILDSAQRYRCMSSGVKQQVGPTRGKRTVAFRFLYYLVVAFASAVLIGILYLGSLVD